MQSRMREVRKARRLTLTDVAERCTPPTTAQTIGRLETGMRTLSIGWLNRIAGALGVEPSELVTMPDRQALPLTARLTNAGAAAFEQPAEAVVPSPTPASLAMRIDDSAGDYRAGDTLWLERIERAGFATALNRDILAPRRAGRFAFGRFIEYAGSRLLILPPHAGSKQIVVEDPEWIGVARQLVRPL